MNTRSLFTLLLLSLALAGFGQPGFEGFNYQAVVRNAAGDPLPNQAVGVRVLIKDSPLASDGYREIHSVTTDAHGQITLVMGTGSVEPGSPVASFGDIDWSNGAAYNYVVSVDITGGSNYTPVGIGMFRSVPFAMHALTSGSGAGGGWSLTGNDLSNTNTGNVGIGTTTPDERLVVTGGNALVKGVNGFVAAGDEGVLYLGDQNSYIKNTFGGGVSVGSYGGPDALYVQQFGNVGVGTTDPKAKLDVNGNINARGGLYLNDSLVVEDDGFGRTQFYHADDGVERMEFNASNTYLSNKNVYVQENMGIGLDPSLEPIDARLHVKGNVKIADGSQGAGKVLTSDADGLATWTTLSSSGGTGWALTGSNLSNTNSGNVGIGTTVPQAKLDVIGRARINGLNVGRGVGNDSTTTVVGVRAVTSSNSSPLHNVAIGFEAMTNPGFASWSTAVGYKALRAAQSNSLENNAFGHQSLTANTTGVLNSAFGSFTLGSNTNGNFNNAFGNGALGLTTTGDENTAVGHLALETNTTGDFNTAVGSRANVSAAGLINATAIGARAYATQSNTLILGSINGVNGATANVKVGIGTTNPQSTLAVNGTITCKEVNVTLAGFPDYVFEKDYHLMPLGEVEQYIQVNGHLPNVPSACEVEDSGIGLGELNKILLEKVEELTLHMIEKDQQIQELRGDLSRLIERTAELLQNTTK